MVLASLVSEFGLQEEIVAGGYAFATGSAQCFSDCGFEVMFALIGSIDARKPERRASSVSAAVRSSFQAVP